MSHGNWPTKAMSVVQLHLDPKNPRLGRDYISRSPREIVQYLFEHDKAIDVAESIATRQYFQNEPLLAIKEDGHYIVVEGNRRLAALKALREPGLLEGAFERKVERLARRMTGADSIARVPVMIAPSRRETDRLIAGRHVGTPVLPWQAENRASFILSKLSEGYDNEELQVHLGFSPADIQQARQTRAIADMARSLNLPEELQTKVDNPRAKLFTTLERVFESKVGRDYLRIERDTETGIKGFTSKEEFLRGFRKLVTDIALGRVNSRTLNTNEQIETYFENWDPAERPKKRKDAFFVPEDIVQPERSVVVRPPLPKKKTASRKLNDKIIPSDLKVRYGNDRLLDIRKELIRLKREEFPNAGAVLLRVFLELSIADFLTRTGALQKLREKLEATQKLNKHGEVKLSQMVIEVLRIARRELTSRESQLVEKALKYDKSAPFTISELHGFVHSPDFPGARDIEQFWQRTEPLFRLMLDREVKDISNA